MTPPATADTPVQPAAVAALPFTASAHEHVEPAFTFTATPGAAVQQINPIDIPAYGYLRHLFLEISCAGGAGGTGNPDFPWNIIQSISLNDVNGANIVGPIDGYALFLANLFGGYQFDNDPRLSPFYVGSAPNPVFYLRVPVEISQRDGLGALANQNAAANYKLNMAINSRAGVTSADWTTPPTITVRGWLEAWTLPAGTDNRGRPQAQVPPLLGTGQFWSASTRAILSGANTIGLTRVGNYVRSLVAVYRDGTGARNDAVAPDPIVLNWDGNQIDNASQRYFQQYNYEKIAGPITRPAGVFVFPFNHAAIGRIGNETPDLWLPTTQSSRIEIAGNSASAGTVQYLVNEVAPVETNQAERYAQPSATGSLADPNVVR